MKRVSVLMPMRDALRYVRPALTSVLSQRNVDLEVVVIDDGSTDGSADLVRQLGDPRVRLVSGPCGGISVALNRGLDVATGEFIARCDADDLYPADRLERQAAFLTDHPEYAAICGCYSTITSKGKPVVDLDCAPDDEEITTELRSGKTRTHLGTYLVRASAYREIGGFRPYFVTAEDIDLQLRLGETARVWFESVPCYVRRLHSGAVTSLQSDAARVFYERTARHFQQQRSAGGDDVQRNCPPLPPEDLVSPPSKAALQIQGMLMAASWREHRAGEKGRAIGTGLRAIRARPSNVKAWRNFAALVLRRADEEG